MGDLSGVISVTLKQMYAYEMHAYEIHAYEMHAYQMHAYEMHACERFMSTREAYYILDRWPTAKARSSTLTAAATSLPNEISII